MIFQMRGVVYVYPYSELHPCTQFFLSRLPVCLRIAHKCTYPQGALFKAIKECTLHSRLCLSAFLRECCDTESWTALSSRIKLQRQDWSHFGHFRLITMIRGRISNTHSKIIALQTSGSNRCSLIRMLRSYFAIQRHC